MKFDWSVATVPHLLDALMQECDRGCGGRAAPAAKSRHAAIGDRALARSLRRPTLGVDALDGLHTRQQPAAALLGDLEFEPWQIVESRSRRGGHHLRPHGASVDVLPVRPGIMQADRLAIEDQRRNRLARLPHELAARIEFALV